MNFSLRLVTPTKPPRRWKKPIREYDPELDTEIAIIDDACEMIAKASDARFEVIALSAEPWRVDVATDLAVVLPQLPEAIGQLRSGRDAILDFYEQGIERSLHFSSKDEGTVRIECRSWHEDWVPEVDVQEIDRRMLLAMLQALRASFYELLLEVSPALAAHAWMQQWNKRSA